MKLNWRFLTTLILIVTVIISFVLIILEVLSFNSSKDYVFTIGTADKKLEELTAGQQATVKTLGMPKNKMLSDTQYYRYGSLIMHIFAILSAVYVAYST